MDATGHDRRELVRAAYEQHAAHARHLESQRLLYTVVYSLLITAIVVFGGGRPFGSSGWPLMALLAVFSLFGFIFCLEIQRTLKAYFGSTALILTRYSLDHYLPGGANHIHQGSPALSKLFPLFFLTGLAFSISILLRILFGSIGLSAIASVAILIVGIIIIWQIDRTAPLSKTGD